MDHGHEVRKDLAGFGGYERYTCYSGGCGEAAIVRQPHMNDRAWEKLKRHFFERHPPANPSIK